MKKEEKKKSIKAILIAILLNSRGYLLSCIRNDPEYELDYHLASQDDQPLFSFFSCDGCIAIDLNEREYGAYCLYSILSEHDAQNLHDAVPPLVGLVLNRSLTAEEQTIAAYIGDIYDYYLTYGCDEIEELYMSVIADNT